MDGLTEHLMYTSINNMKIINSEGTRLILRYRSKLQARPWRYFIFRGLLLFVLILFIFIYILTKANKLTRKWTSFGMFICTILVFERKSPEEGGGVGVMVVFYFFNQYCFHKMCDVFTNWYKYIISHVFDK